MVSILIRKPGLIYLLCLIFVGIMSFPVQADPEPPIQLVAAGDIMLDSWIEQVVRDQGWHYPFVHLDSILNTADLVFANLEAPFGRQDSAYPKTYTFQVEPEMVQVLTAGKINMVSLANNHILDFGAGALKETMQLLDAHRIKYSGAGNNLWEARQPARFEIKGKKVAVACYSLTFPEEFWATDSTAGTCFPSHTFFYQDIRRFKEENDVLVISFHWGGELLTAPKEYQVDLAHRAIDAGADLILGHHPHVIQGLEIYKGKLIAYSLGNYIFGSYSDKATRSMLLRLSYSVDSFEQCTIIPIDVHNRFVEFQPRLLKDADKINFFNELIGLSQELNNQPLVINSAGEILFN
jgi:poly-gamma-glutamate capsule biosynthesis protein CapA/YwtB (metallophosphatase superfamily)